MNVVVLTNTDLASLSGRHRNALDLLADSFGRTPHSVSIRKTGRHQFNERAAQAVKSGAGAVVAVGGDGTISSVAAALVDRQTPLGVIPLGTFNHFARDIGISLSPDQAVKTIAAGAIRRIDVGEVNSHTFVNNASIGAYPAMVVDRERQQVRFGRSKWRAMLRSAWRVIRRFPLMEVRLNRQSNAPWCTTPCIFVGNNRYRFDLLAPGSRAALDHGRLSIYVMRTTSRVAVVRLGLKAALGKLADDDNLIACESEEFWVECRRHRRVAVGMDGEVHRLTTPLHFRIRTKALQVIVPSQHGANENS